MVGKNDDFDRRFFVQYYMNNEDFFYIRKFVNRNHTKIG